MSYKSRHKSPEMLLETEGNWLRLRGQVAGYRLSNDWCNAIITPRFFRIFAKSVINVTLHHKLRDVSLS